jgi:hypothetical protein
VSNTTQDDILRFESERIVHSAEKINEETKTIVQAVERLRRAFGVDKEADDA